MRWLINYIRSRFCKHDWELLEKANVYLDGNNTDIKDYSKWIYRCKKCGCKKIYLENFSYAIKKDFKKSGGNSHMSLDGAKTEIDTWQLEKQMKFLR